MKVDEITKSTRSTVLTVLIVIGMAAFYNWTFVPYTKYVKAAQKLEQSREKLSFKENVLSKNIKREQQELAELTNELEYFRSKCFSEEQAEEFFRQIDTIAEKTYCTINSLDFINEKTDTEDRPLAY